MSRPFSSNAQRAKWKTFVEEGRVTQDQFDERERLTAGRPLPDRAAPRVRTVGASRAVEAAKFGDSRY